MIVGVTGGAGFIGSAVVAQLERAGHTPIIFDRPRDVRNMDEVEQFVRLCNGVIHLAGMLGTHELFDKRREAVEVNVLGSLNVMDACVAHGVRFVNISMPPVFPSIYTATKMSVEAFLKAYAHNDGLRYASVRAFNAFGPGQHHGPGHPQKIIPTFAFNGWRGLPIPVWGDGDQGVDLVHVSDVADVMVQAVELADGGTYDAGTGRMFTVLEVARLVQLQTGNRSRIDHLPMRRGEIPTKIVAKGEGWEKLDRRPQFRMADLRTTVDAYAATLEWEVAA